MHIIALFGCAVAVLAWGAAGVFDKLAVRGADPFGAVLARMAMATLLILGFCVVTGRAREALQLSPRTYLMLACSGACGAFIGQLGYFLALKYAPASQVVPTTATYPVVALLLAVLFLREQLTPLRVVGVLLVVLGLMLVSGAGDGRPTAPEADSTASAEGRPPSLSDHEGPEGGSRGSTSEGQ